MADFSVLADLPQMYRHCKATEDKDMNVVDFITDHLINIDGAFDAHDSGDEQKPHSPFQFNNTLQQVLFIVFPSFVSFSEAEMKVQTTFYAFENFYYSDFFSKVFRPPIG